MGVWKDQATLTIANSGSKEGSTPNSKSPPEEALGPSPPVPPSSVGILALRSSESMGEDIRASEISRGPGGTTTRWLINQKLATALKREELRDIRIIATGCVFHERFQHGFILLPGHWFLYAITKAHDIHRDVVLLQFLG